MLRKSCDLKGRVNLPGAQCRLLFRMLVVFDKRVLKDPMCGIWECEKIGFRLVGYMKRTDLIVARQLKYNQSRVQFGYRTSENCSLANGELPE